MVLCTFLSFKDLIPWINATSHYKQEKNFIFKDVGASILYFLCSSDLYRSLENLYNNGPGFTNIRKASLFFPRHWAMCLAWSTKIFTLKIIFFSWTSCGAQYNTITSLKSPKAEPAWIWKQGEFTLCPQFKKQQIPFVYKGHGNGMRSVTQHKSSQGKLTVKSRISISEISTLKCTDEKYKYFTCFLFMLNHKYLSCSVKCLPRGNN